MNKKIQPKYARRIREMETITKDERIFFQTLCGHIGREGDCPYLIHKEETVCTKYVVPLDFDICLNTLRCEQCTDDIGRKVLELKTAGLEMARSVMTDNEL